MKELYEKKGRKYIKVGVEFNGFPHNGYWIVLDGRRSLIAPIEHPRPIELCRFMQYREDILNKLEIKSRSPYEMVNDVLILLEECVNNSNSDQNDRLNDLDVMRELNG